MLKNYGDMIVG